MKYIAFIIWLLISGLLCLFVIPGLVAFVCGWFSLGNKILES
jgi:hypothetical protein